MDALANVHLDRRVVGARHPGLICRFGVALDLSQALVTTHRCYEIGATTSLCQPSTGGLTQSMSRRSAQQPSFVTHIAKPVPLMPCVGSWVRIPTSMQCCMRARTVFKKLLAAWGVPG